jgi:hypothetical protein
MLQFICTLMSGVALTIITQQVIARYEGKKAIRGRQLDYYLLVVDRIADLCVKATSGGADERPLEADYIKTQLMLSVIGDETVMETFYRFHEFLSHQRPVDPQRILKEAGKVAYAICCQIHGEPYRPAP